MGSIPGGPRPGDLFLYTKHAIQEAGWFISGNPYRHPEETVCPRGDYEGGIRGDEEGPRRIGVGVNQSARGRGSPDPCFIRMEMERRGLDAELQAQEIGRSLPMTAQDIGHPPIPGALAQVRRRLHAPSVDLATQLISQDGLEITGGRACKIDPALVHGIKQRPMAGPSGCVYRHTSPDWPRCSYPIPSDSPMSPACSSRCK